MPCFFVTTAHHDDIGASLVEYALLVALIAVVCIASMQTFSSSVQKKSLMNTCLINNGTGERATEQCNEAVNDYLRTGLASSLRYIEGND